MKDESTMIAEILASLIESGRLNPKGKTKDQLYQEMLQIIQSKDFEYVLDHTQDILFNARRFKRLKKTEFSCLFYALFFEHKINEFIYKLAFRKRMSKNDVEQMIRDTSYKAKMTWLLKLFSMTPIIEPHLGVIIQVMELRNNFVHYKWKPINKELNNQANQILKGVEKTIRYLRYYDVKYLHAIPVKRIKKLIE